MTYDEAIEYATAVIEQWKDWVPESSEQYQFYTLSLKILEKVRDGRMIELPCKVGATIYKILDVEWDVGEYEIYYISISQNDHTLIRFHAECHSHDVDEITFYSDEIGKTVFLTRAEAEEALRERSESC